MSSTIHDPISIDDEKCKGIIAKANYIKKDSQTKAKMQTDDEKNENIIATTDSMKKDPQTKAELKTDDKGKHCENRAAGPRNANLESIEPKEKLLAAEVASADVKGGWGATKSTGWGAIKSTGPISWKQGGWGHAKTNVEWDERNPDSAWQREIDRENTERSRRRGENAATWAADPSFSLWEMMCPNCEGTGYVKDYVSEAKVRAAAALRGKQEELAEMANKLSRAEETLRANRKRIREFEERDQRKDDSAPAAKK